MNTKRQIKGLGSRRPLSLHSKIFKDNNKLESRRILIGKANKLRTSLNQVALRRYHDDMAATQYELSTLPPLSDK